MEKSIKHKVVVITGGAGGLGLATAYKVVGKGAKVTVLLDTNEQNGADAIAALTEKFGSDKAAFFKCDVTTDLEDVFEKIINEYKTIDVLINSAGVLDEKSIRKTIAVNTTASMEWSSKFYDYARKDRGGRGGTVINVSSIYGLCVYPYLPSYHASKFAVIGFSKSLGHEYNYKKTGVRILVLCPGLTLTKFVATPAARDDEATPDLVAQFNAHENQEADVVGREIIEVFEKANSGTVWQVAGSRSAEIVTI